MKRRTLLLLPLISGLLTAQLLFANSYTVDVSSLVGAKVQYSEHSQLSHFPAPVLYFRRAGLVSGASEIKEIKEKILFPLVKESPKAVSAIVIEFFPNQRTLIGVLVLWADGEARESLIARSEAGKYDPAAYKLFFKKPTP